MRCVNLQGTHKDNTQNALLQAFTPHYRKKVTKRK